MKRLLIVVFALLLVNPAAAQTPVTIRLGIIGDSASDEYRGSDNRGGAYASVTRNWIELLQIENIARPGAWGNWGEPRRTGYEYNWARSAARTENLQQQADGLAAQISALRNTAQAIGAVVIWGGANNFANYANGSYNAICTGSLSGQALNDFIAQRAAHIEQAVQTVRTADPNIRLLIATIPDLNWSPSISGCGDPNGPARVTAAINQTNELITDIIATYGAATLNAADIMARLPGNIAAIVAASGGTFPFNANGVGDAPTNGILGDAIHSGTIFNCITANEVVAALNTRYGLNLPRVSDAQCLARVGYNVTPTATPSATPTTAQTATPTTVSTFTPMPTNTPVPTSTPTNTSVPTNTPTFPVPSTATPTDTPPTLIPTVAPSATPGCSVNNAGYSVGEPAIIQFTNRPLDFDYPPVGDVLLIGKTFSFVARQSGVYTINFLMPGAVVWSVCFTVN